MIQNKSPIIPNGWLYCANPGAAGADWKFTADEESATRLAASEGFAVVKVPDDLYGKTLPCAKLAFTMIADRPVLTVAAFDQTLLKPGINAVYAQPLEPHEVEPVAEVVDMKYNLVQFSRAAGDDSKPYLQPGTKLYTGPCAKGKAIAYRTVDADGDVGMWFDAHPASLGSALVDAERGVVSKIEVAYSSADVAEADRLRAELAEWKERFQRGESTVKYLSIQVDGLREVLADAVEDAKSFLASDRGWDRYGTRRDEIEARYDAALAAKEAPAPTPEVERLRREWRAQGEQITKLSRLLTAATKPPFQCYYCRFGVKVNPGCKCEVCGRESSTPIYEPLGPVAEVANLTAQVAQLGAMLAEARGYVDCDSPISEASRDDLLARIDAVAAKNDQEKAS